MRFCNYVIIHCLRLKCEIDTVIGTKSEITFEDLSELKYTGCCIKEALRLWPPAPNLSRSCIKKLETEKFSIPSILPKLIYPS